MQKITLLSTPVGFTDFKFYPPTPAYVTVHHSNGTQSEFRATVSTPVVMRPGDYVELEEVPAELERAVEPGYVKVEDLDAEEQTEEEKADKKKQEEADKKKKDEAEKKAKADQEKWNESLKKEEGRHQKRVDKDRLGKEIKEEDAETGTESVTTTGAKPTELS